MRVHAVINRRAGSVFGLNAEDLAREVETAFRRSGHDITLDIANPNEIDAALDAAVASKPDLLIAGGGDGTIRAAASKLLANHSGTALGILPLGTVNRLARDLHIPLEPSEALLAFQGSIFRQIDVAEVNGSVFLCNSLLGLPPDVSEERQLLRGRSLPARISGYFKLLKTILASRRRIELVIDDQKSERHVRVLSLAVSNNLYSHAPTLVFSRQTLDGGMLGIYIAKPRSGLGLLWVLARAALGLWSGDERLDSLSATRVVIGSHRKTIRLSNDGEVEKFETPLRYQIYPKVLTVYAPKVPQQ